MQQLPGPLPRPEVAARQAEVRVNHTNQGQMREMMALGDDLGADQQIDLPPRHRTDDLRRCRRSGDQITGHQGDTGIGEDGLCLLRQTFHARAACLETVRITTLGTDSGAPYLMAAMMALQPPEIAMLDQPGRAVRAFDTMAAGIAERQRRITPPVQEQQGLLSGGQGFLHRLLQPAADPATTRRAVVAHVHDLHRRQFGGTIATLQLLVAFAGSALLLAALGIYAVLSYSVTERTKEIGIRKALGESAGDIRRGLVQRTIGLAVAGIVLGLGGAWLAVTRHLGRV